MTDNDSGRRVIDLANARKTVKRGNPKLNGGLNGKGRSGQQRGPDRLQWWRYLQFFLLLGIVAYMMQLCRSGG